MRDEDTPDLRGVVARVEGVPPAAKIDFDPGCKIHRCIRRWKGDVGKVTGAIARRDVQAAAEGDRKVCVVTANAAALYICFGCGSGGAGVLVAKGDVVVYEVADGLHP